MIDTDNSGTITFEELKEGLKKVGSQLRESEIKALMDAVRKKLICFFQYIMSIKELIILSIRMFNISYVLNLAG